MTGAGEVVRTPLGEREPDSRGSAVGAARINPAGAYQEIPRLLKEFIDSGREPVWREIASRVDRVYEAVSAAMDALDKEVSFSAEVRRRVEEAGQDLFFKPNLVAPMTIDRLTHGPGNIGVCTPWEFVAALMRWFHDRLGISYHHMSLGEGGSVVSATAGAASAMLGRPVTTLAVMEGRVGDSYGGWGFYFARKYLADRHDAGHTDDPMAGYEESLAGECLPPGRARDRLRLYDINKIADDGSNGRDVPVSDGINFREITLHKIVVGGDPTDRADRADWPGCVLVNVPKLKIHQLELITCAIKNLGVGLYPMEAREKTASGELRWKYATPHRPTPTLKTVLPHTIWVGEADEETGMPRRDEKGNYVFRQTGGMEATMADVIQAAKEQDVLMLHVVDAIEATNVYHAGPVSVPVPEGFVFASLDPVAVDVLAARYLFSMVPVEEARRLQQELGLPTDAIQRVPLPVVEGRNIVTRSGYDTPFARYRAFAHCESRGLGVQDFYVVGRDLWEGGRLASVEHRLGRIEDGVFTELLTKTLYFAILKPLWDLQATSLAYLDASDRLTGSDSKRAVLEAFDENGDGVIDYSEKGFFPGLEFMAYGARLMALQLEPAELLRIRFLLTALPLRLMRKEWNREGHDLGLGARISGALAAAFFMSQAAQEQADPFVPGLTWGQGKWPSLPLAMLVSLGRRFYGLDFPERFDLLTAPYGQAFRYADARWNGGKYAPPEVLFSGEDVIGRYHADVARGREPLPFVVYVPPGLGSLGNGPIPNVEETDDPDLLFTASFSGGEVVWRDFRLSEIP